VQANFLRAFERHLKDGEILFTCRRLANADHLYGCSAECGLKRLMLAFGMPLEPGGTGKPQKRDDLVHADKIWDRYQVYRAGYSSTRYMLSQQNPFYNWSINDRYADESGFDLAYVEPHKNAAREVETIIIQAMEDGLL
jgi:hypothetical protein